MLSSEPRGERNKDKINAARREAWANDPEFRARHKRWLEANPDKVRQNQKDRTARMSDEERAHRNAYNQTYYAANSDQWTVYRRRREALLAEVEYQPYTRQEIFERDGGKCRGCHKQLTNEPRAFQIDHIVPISLGGPDIPANLQLMCPKCNRAKWANLEGQIHLPV